MDIEPASEDLIKARERDCREMNRHFWTGTCEMCDPRRGRDEHPLAFKNRIRGINDKPEVSEDERSLIRYHLAWELLIALENVPVDGDPSWLGWSHSVNMKGRMLAIFIATCKEKGIEVPRR